MHRKLFLLLNSILNDFNCKIALVFIFYYKNILGIIFPFKMHRKWFLLLNSTGNYFYYKTALLFILY